MGKIKKNPKIQETQGRAITTVTPLLFPILCTIFFLLVVTECLTKPIYGRKSLLFGVSV